MRKTGNAFAFIGFIANLVPVRLLAEIRIGLDGIIQFSFLNAKIPERRIGMLPKNEIARRLFENLSERVTGKKVEEVRAGLGYVAVALDKKCIGLAAVLRQDLEFHCGVLAKAGTFTGTPALDLLNYLVNGRNPLERALGLATANAILSAKASHEESDAIALMNLSSDDHVVMIGLFRPLVARIEQTGARLMVLEKNKSRTIPNI